MPLSADLVGRQVGRLAVCCDSRWLMAYAAGVPDERPELYDTRGQLVMHPMFPVAPEWELLTTSPPTPASMTTDEVLRGVHAAHDVLVVRSVRAGETIDLTATVSGVDRWLAGAVQTTVFDATDHQGAIVWRTRFTSLFRGVGLDGDPSAIDAGWPPDPPLLEVGPTPLAESRSHVRRVDAHVYTECARIWNPIHTDIAVANRVGLDAPILHGTATLARAVSTVCATAGVPLRAVRRVVGSFRAVVTLDSTITIRLLAASSDSVHFDVLNERGEPAVRGGALVISPV